MSTKGPRWADVRGDVETRKFEVTGSNAAMGRSSIDIACPFCDAFVVAYIWSLSGGGKRCSCGALLGPLGVAYHWTDPARPPQSPRDVAPPIVRHDVSADVAWLQAKYGIEPITPKETES